MTNAPPKRWQSLQSAVRRARLSYTELAKLAGTTRQSISAYARGTRRPPENMVAILAEVLGVPADELRADAPSTTTSPEDIFKEIDGLCAVLDQRMETATTVVNEIKARREQLQQFVAGAA